MKHGIILALLMVVSGCTSKLAYNNLDWLVYWYMDDYVELNDQQEAIFDKQLNQWISWHKSNELPEYVDHLQVIRNDIAENKLTHARLMEHYSRAKEHWQRFRIEISPSLARMAKQLNDDQVIRLFAALESDNKETEESISKTHAKSHDDMIAERVEDLTSNMEERIGDLTKEQQAIVERFAPQFKSSSALTVAYRRDLQQRARKLFITRNTNPEFEAELTALMLDPEQYRTEEYLTVWRHNRELHAEMASEIAATLTSRQKKQLLGEIDDLIDDLKGLMK